jgi:transcription initiation factor IIF auxiliary subunit
MVLTLKNTSEYVERRGNTDWWKWTAYLDGDDAELDAIAFVEYHLHPSFPNPIRRIKVREGGFPVSSKGWGVFELTAKIVFKNKGKPKILKHWLEFDGAEIED